MLREVVTSRASIPASLATLLARWCFGVQFKCRAHTRSIRSAPGSRDRHRHVTIVYTKWPLRRAVAKADAETPRGTDQRVVGGHPLRRLERS